MELLLSVQGEDPVADLEELSDWLSRDTELRGAVRFAPAEPGPGELGGLSDFLVTAVGAGGALTVLAASLKNFLSLPRRSDVRIVITKPDGQRIELDGKRIGNVESVLRELRELTEPDE
ncbi:effector-associated constant component EACC1 [Amycolatopsis sp. cmx-8-4]|uniref:effector-associated constant component EACC1 n=1 Tax=Amycolatopsis sp. cmx-8-4 TaxID=2790947 RepID=UPI00397E3F4B